MREWRRANRRQLCGGCNRRVAIDDPILVLQIGSVEKIRCALCAGPAPPDLPAVIVTAVILPFDFARSGVRWRENRVDSLSGAIPPERETDQ